MRLLLSSNDRRGTARHEYGGGQDPITVPDRMTNQNDSHSVEFHLDTPVSDIRTLSIRSFSMNKTFPDQSYLDGWMVLHIDGADYNILTPYGSFTNITSWLTELEAVIIGALPALYTVTLTYDTRFRRVIYTFDPVAIDVMFAFTERGRGMATSWGFNPGEWLYWQPANPGPMTCISPSDVDFRNGNSHLYIALKPTCDMDAFRFSGETPPEAIQNLLGWVPINWATENRSQFWQPRNPQVVEIFNDQTITLKHFKIELWCKVGCSIFYQPLCQGMNWCLELELETKDDRGQSYKKELVDRQFI